MKSTFWALISLFFLASCSPRVIERVDKQTDTLYQTKYLRDSIFLHDSVSTSIYASNDTVYITKYKSTIKYREKLKTDTLLKVKEILNTDTEVIEVKKKNSWFTNFVFGFLLGGFILLILEICLLKNNRKT